MTQQDTSLLDAVMKLSERVRALEERETFIGNDVIAPAYAAPIGTDHFDSNLRNLWVNYDGTAPGWQLIGGSGSVIGSGTTPELAYWTGATTLGSATDIEFIAGGGLDFQAGGAAPSNALIQVADNVADALHVSDAGGLEFLRLDTQNANPYFLIDPGATNSIKVGIGTATPSSVLNIESPNSETIEFNCNLGLNALIRLTSTTQGRLFFRNGATSVNEGAVYYDHPTNLMTLRAGNVERVFINNGNFGAGTNTPARQIHAQVNQGSTNTVGNLLRLSTLTAGGAAAAGLGTGMEWELETSTASNVQIAARTFTRWTNPALAQYSAEFCVEVASGASLIEMMCLDGNNTQPSAIFNEGGNDVDFRAETTVDTHSFFMDAETGWTGFGATVPEQAVEIEETELLEASPGDGYAAALRLDPGYDDNNNGYTVTRHNYIEFQNVQLLDTAAVTDGCALAFDAAAGTHAAVDSGTTKTTPGTVDAWPKVNINGTLYYMPLYLSKTS